LRRFTPALGRTFVDARFDPSSRVMFVRNERGEPFRVDPTTLRAAPAPWPKPVAPDLTAALRATWPDGEQWSIRGDYAQSLIKSDGSPASGIVLYNGAFVRDGDATLRLDDPPSIVVTYTRDLADARTSMARIDERGAVLWARAWDE